MRKLGIWLFLVSPLALEAESGFRPLFNGKDLSEWIIDTPGLWRVQDGVIIGTSPGLPYNDFLRTKKTYRNFILQVSFRLTDPTGRANSGIQFRSKPAPDSHEVIGYQADIGQQYWGCLYDESRRKRVLAPASAEALATVNKTGWNRYTIRAEGRRITLELNGVQSAEWLENEEVEDSGFIALQLHSGPPFQVEFKDLRILELDRSQGR
ncbi:MAG: DUF1080 domain-containing protein [Bryobacteraceae bacterium]|nr:DUF1080 domain-containing protein [Bryobacteraceae bacterium]MDW8377003.1 DUF1080 domain-containing protein [Bryobacterales bacterium]